MSGARDWAGPGAWSEKWADPLDASVCLCLFFAETHALQYKSCLLVGFLRRESCFYRRVDRQCRCCNRNIWTFRLKNALLMSQTLPTFPLKSDRFSSPRWSAPMPSDFVSLLSSDLDLNSPNSLYSKGKIFINYTLLWVQSYSDLCWDDENESSMIILRRELAGVSLFSAASLQS